MPENLADLIAKIYKADFFFFFFLTVHSMIMVETQVSVIAGKALSIDSSLELHAYTQGVRCNSIKVCTRKRKRKTQRRQIPCTLGNPS